MNKESQNRIKFKKKYNYQAINSYLVSDRIFSDT